MAALNYPGPVDWMYFSDDQHAIAGAMKQYLRELPEPLLTFEVRAVGKGVKNFWVIFRPSVKGLWCSLFKFQNRKSDRHSYWPQLAKRA